MPNAILHADLEHLNLGSLLQLSEAEFISGRIIIDAVGHIELSGGQPVAAATDNGLDGRDAIYELFLENTGAVRIELDARVGGTAIAPTISLIMEGCRLLDEWGEVADRRLAVIRDTSQVSGAEAAALTALVLLLPHLKREPLVAAAAQAAKVPRTPIIGHIRTLIHAGILKDAPKPTPSSAKTGPGAAPPPPLVVAEVIDDPAELLARGRQAFRDSELQLAEELWARALGILPNDRVLAQNLRLVRQRLSGLS